MKVKELLLEYISRENFKLTVTRLFKKYKITLFTVSTNFDHDRGVLVGTIGIPCLRQGDKVFATNSRSQGDMDLSQLHDDEDVADELQSSMMNSSKMKRQLEKRVELTNQLLRDLLDTFIPHGLTKVGTESYHEPTWWDESDLPPARYFDSKNDSLQILLQFGKELKDPFTEAFERDREKLIKKFQDFENGSKIISFIRYDTEFNLIYRHPHVQNDKKFQELQKSEAKSQEIKTYVKDFFAKFDQETSRDREEFVKNVKKIVADFVRFDADASKVSTKMEPIEVYRFQQVGLASPQPIMLDKTFVRVEIKKDFKKFESLK